MKRFLQEPLAHFLVLGAGLFLIFEWRGGFAPLPAGSAGTPARKIVVTQNDQEQLIARFTKTWQRSPTSEEVKGLVNSFVRDEIFYREAQAAGLDRDDSVIKRRLRMQMEFMLEDVATIGEPSEADLQAFLEQHREKYSVESQLAFRHVYINTDRRKENAAAYASQTLAQLNQGVDPGTVGDPFALGAEFGVSSLAEINRQFGDGFGKKLLDLPGPQWAGPVTSGFGLHLVQITERRERRLPGLDEIRNAVKADWTTARQEQLKDAAYAKLRERYSVEIEGNKTPALPAVAKPQASMAQQ